MAYLDYEGLKRYDTKLKNYVAEQRKPIPVICSIHDWQSSWGNSALTDAISGTSYTPDEYGHKALMPVAAFSGKFGHLLSAGDILLVTIATSSNYNYSLDYISNYSGKMWLAFDRFNGGSLTSTNGLWLTIPNLPTGQNHSFAFVIHDSGAALIDYDRLSGWSDCNGRLLIETRSYDTDSAMDTHLVVNSTYGEYSCLDADQAVKWGTIDLDDSYEPLMGVRVSSSSASTELKPAAVISSMGNTSAKLAYNGLFITDSGDAYANLKSDATLLLGNDSGLTTISQSAITFEDDQNTTLSTYNAGYLEFKHNDIYSIGVSSTAFWIEASSSDLSISDGGISIYNYGDGDITPTICLSYENSYEYAITLRADENNATISCSDINVSTEITPGTVTTSMVQTSQLMLHPSLGDYSYSRGPAGYVPVAQGGDYGVVYWSRPPVYKSAVSTSNAPYYPILSANASTGTDTNYYVSSKYHFNPSTETLTSPTVLVKDTLKFTSPSLFTGTSANYITMRGYYNRSSISGTGSYYTECYTGSVQGTFSQGTVPIMTMEEALGIWTVYFGVTYSASSLFTPSQSITGIILSTDDTISMEHFLGVDTTVNGNVVTTYYSTEFGFSASSDDYSYYPTISGTTKLRSHTGWRPTIQAIKRANLMASTTY